MINTAATLGYRLDDLDKLYTSQTGPVIVRTAGNVGLGNKVMKDSQLTIMVNATVTGLCGRGKSPPRALSTAAGLEVVVFGETGVVHRVLCTGI